jgi:DNA-binding MarR family transcriptional regulator/GNAT superfamily N-acetyltransferase
METPAMAVPDLDEAIEAMRRFGRLYTRRIGVLGRAYLDSPFSLTEARVLFELARQAPIPAAALANDLDLDPGYLSRILKGLARRQLLSRAPAPEDGRQTLLALSRAGREAFAALDAASRRQIGAMLERLSAAERQRLTRALGAVERLLAEPATAAPSLGLRAHQPGDLGWIVQRHGALYAAEYGWDARFEALVARIVAEFAESFEPARERIWIAELEREPVGSIMLARADATTAKLRLLLVEPDARGRGVGRRLVAECIGFARAVGYRRMTLWTNSVLEAARRLYVEAGFTLVASEPHHSFGVALVGETWQLDLARARSG